MEMETSIVFVLLFDTFCFLKQNEKLDNLTFVSAMFVGAAHVTKSVTRLYNYLKRGKGKDSRSRQPGTLAKRVPLKLYCRLRILPK